MKNVYYCGYKCEVLKTWSSDTFFDLKTVKKTEKNIYETFLSVHKSEIVEHKNN